MSRTPIFRSEKDVKKHVKKLFNDHDWFWWMPAGTAFGTAGVSDFNALKNGVFIAVETKFGSNKLTPMQKGFLESINAATGFGFVVNESNIGQLETFLTQFGESTDLVAAEGKMGNEAGATMLDAIRALQALI